MGILFRGGLRPYFSNTQGTFGGDCLDSSVAQGLLSSFLGSCIFMMARGTSRSSARCGVGDGALGWVPPNPCWGVPGCP